ncbi:capon-like protein isoform X2 [Uranotaenia lowii]|uniref:capon-like protein isoform X2 n=1 Tax=Uranotaenia lowii TaxID=190385 RepID=UPI00247A7401|nr:capon-like protein isoform X2 [Uranotaenia lowii]
MIKQKSEDIQLDYADPLTSPNSKRKNESTLRQLQNDVMGKARSTLSSLGDVLKGSKNVPGGSNASSPSADSANKVICGETNAEGSEQSFSTPPRSPKTPKDKNSLDFFSWSKSKNKDIPKNVKKDKIKSQQSQLSDVNEEENEEDIKSDFTATTKQTSTGAIKKKPGQEITISKYHNQGTSQRKHNTDYVESHGNYRSEYDFRRSMEDGLHYITRDNAQYADKYYDSRPKSYNEKYLQTYNYMQNMQEYDESYEDEVVTPSKGPRKLINPSSPATKHILFNEENDVLYYKDNQRYSKNKPNDQLSRDKPKGPQPKTSSIKDNRKLYDSTPIPIRKISKEDKNLNVHAASTASDKNITKNNKTAVPIDEKKSNQKAYFARPTLSRDYSIDHRTANNSGNLEANESNTNNNLRRHPAEDYCDKKMVRKICFQEPSYEPVTKSDTLPRSRKPVADSMINEYLDTDMIRPRSGSVDSDLESQAMRIVRTVGQAFEVCHKLSLQDSVEIADEPSEASLCDFSDQDKISDEENIKKDIISESDEAILPGKNNKTDMSSISNMYSSQPPSQENGNESTLKKTPLSASQEVVCLREQLDHQQLQTRQVVAQLMLVRDQLITETNARIEAQARTQQLLQQNRELLEHIASIGGYHEPDRPGLSSTAIGLAPQNQQINDVLNMGALGKHFQTVQPLSSNQNPAIHQPLSNVNSGSFSALNKLHNMAAFQSTGNFMSPTSNLTVQDLYKLNQNILNQLTNVNYNPLYSLYPTANVNNTQHQPNNFIYTNQNAAGFSNVKNVANAATTNASSMNAATSPGDHQKSSLPTKSVSDSKERSFVHNDTSVAHDGNGPRTQFIKPLSQVGTLTTMDADGKIKVIVPIDTKEQLELPKTISRKSTSFSELSGDTSVEGSTKSISILKDSKDKKSSIPSLVTLKVTDESGTTTRRLPATPSFITRSTSEKVPNRSQIMSQVQRTQWARHTTK